jgi:hypothetical protein
MNPPIFCINTVYFLQAPPLSETVITVAVDMHGVGVEKRTILATLYQMLGHPPSEDQPPKSKN